MWPTRETIVISGLLTDLHRPIGFGQSSTAFRHPRRRRRGVTVRVDVELHLVGGHNCIPVEDSLRGGVLITLGLSVDHFGLSFELLITSDWSVDHFGLEC